MRWWPATVRLRATLAAIVAVAVVLTVASVVLVRMQRDRLIENLDNTLRLRVDTVAEQLADGGADLADELSRDGEVGLIQIVDTAGTVLQSTANVAGDPPVATAPAAGEVVSTVASLPVDDDNFRILSRRVTTPSGDVVVHAGASVDPALESVAALRTTLWILGPAVVALLGGVVWLLTGRMLGPIEAIRAEAAAMGGHELGRRVPVPATDDEVGRLARTVNELLDRIEVSAGSQRRFVADVSHELRTPLTRMRSRLEVDAAHPDGSDPALARADLLDDVVALQRLVDDLLLLARSDAGAVAVGSEVVDLDDLLLAEARHLRQSGTRHVDTTGISAGQVTGDPTQLRRMIANLTDNAVRHASSRVELALRETEDRVELSVDDDGVGVAPADRARIFDRFVRLDEARSRGDGGSGLGLAIAARDIVERHGGSIEVGESALGGARFVVRLPAQP